MYINQIPQNNNLNDYFSDIWDKISAPIKQGSEQIESVQKTAENLNTTAQELMNEGKQAMKILRPAMVILGVELALLLLFSDIKLYQDINWNKFKN